MSSVGASANISHRFGPLGARRRNASTNPSGELLFILPTDGGAMMRAIAGTSSIECCAPACPHTRNRGEHWRTLAELGIHDWYSALAFPSALAIGVAVAVPDA